MKKFLSFILACVLCFAAIPAAAFADTVSTDDLFGVILDAEGNVVEYLQMPKGDTYVNTIYVIPGGGKWVSYQYSTTQSFLFGFAATDYDKKTVITEPDSSFELWVELSNTLGGGNRVILNDYIWKEPLGGTITNGYTTFLGAGETNYKYCNGKLVNTSSASLTVRMIVIRNFDWEKDDPRDL